MDFPAHRALFNPQGWVFTSKMDGELKPELSFSYRLRSITTGNRVLYQQGESSPSPTASKNRISYYRGEDITERYLPKHGLKTKSSETTLLQLSNG